MSLMFLFFFFNDTATTEIYTLSLHDALPISSGISCVSHFQIAHEKFPKSSSDLSRAPDRKSTRLNSSHSQISYAVFCLKKKKNQIALQLRDACQSHLTSTIQLT